MNHSDRATMSHVCFHNIDGTALIHLYSIQNERAFTELLLMSEWNFATLFKNYVKIQNRVKYGIFMNDKYGKTLIYGGCIIYGFPCQNAVAHNR